MKKHKKAETKKVEEKKTEEKKVDKKKAHQLLRRFRLLNSTHTCEECGKAVNLLYLLLDGRYVCEDCKIELTGDTRRVSTVITAAESTEARVERAKLTNKTANELVNSFGDKIVRNGNEYLLFMNGKQIMKSKRISRLRKEAKKKRKVKDRLTWTKG